ncbi:MAG: hypothetical protein AABP62_16805 [Planctomycetota bacterium]
MLDKVRVASQRIDGYLIGIENVRLGDDQVVVASDRIGHAAELTASFGLGLAISAVGPRRTKDHGGVEDVIVGHFQLHLNAGQKVSLDSSLPARKAVQLLTLIVIPAPSNADIVTLHHAAGKRGDQLHVDSGECTADDPHLVEQDLMADEMFRSRHEVDRDQSLGHTMGKVDVGAHVPQLAEGLQTKSHLAEQRTTGIVVVEVGVGAEDAIQLFGVVPEAASNIRTPLIRIGSKAANVTEEHSLPGKRIGHDFHGEDGDIAPDPRSGQHTRSKLCAERFAGSSGELVAEQPSVFDGVAELRLRGGLFLLADGHSRGHDERHAKAQP